MDASDSDDDDLMIDTTPDAPPPNLMPPSSTTLDPSLPAFAALPASAQVLDKKDEFRRVIIPPHRMTPLKKEWINIYTPLVEMAGLQVRMNVKRKCVEIKVRPPTQMTELTPREFALELTRPLTHRYLHYFVFLSLA
jgi:RNA-binding protein PNO1